MKPRDEAEHEAQKQDDLLDMKPNQEKKECEKGCSFCTKEYTLSADFLGETETHRVKACDDHYALAMVRHQALVGNERRRQCERRGRILFNPNEE